MDWQLFVNIGGTAALSIAGWFIHGVIAAHQKTEDRLVAFQIEVAKEYVTHVDLREIRDTLIRIEARLNAQQAKA